MTCYAVVLVVLGSFYTNRIISWVVMQFLKGTLWKTTVKGQMCMMQNQTSLLNRWI